METIVRERLSSRLTPLVRCVHLLFGLLSGLLCWGAVTEAADADHAFARYCCGTIAVLLVAWTVRFSRDAVLLGTVWVEDGHLVVRGPLWRRVIALRDPGAVSVGPWRHTGYARQIALTLRVRGFAGRWQRVRFIRRSSLLAPDVERRVRRAARDMPAA